eukprot:CAMPEP_0113294164 /NCGR_PEP_ID=MMETSP0008_2-20120614/35745_1 /TAXON_ID=97485 /ORGANISM="Prymnesium parvum" /LENGTH=258 /DNA_ID=CAMNT_0000146743 /DNA_START=20 /DNA_END=796 /DNA_ORIENTATION=- /assembly_acc=CAM_ASM_000153
MVRVQRITPELLLASTSQAKMSKPRDRPDVILSKQSHLSLDNKHIKEIDGLTGCPLLRVLYLFDNQIEVLDGMQDVPHLTHLYLQHNQIRAIGDITMLRKLQKLYLNGNRIPSLEPLAAVSQSLVELHVSSQRPPEGILHLSPETLQRMHVLRVLSIANNRLTDITPLRLLRALQILDASRNILESLAAVLPVVENCTTLLELDLSDNPLSSRRQSMDALIVNSHQLRVLNGRTIIPAERPYLEGLLRRGARQPPSME